VEKKHKDKRKLEADIRKRKKNKNLPEHVINNSGEEEQVGEES